MNRKDYKYGISRTSILVHGFRKSNDDRTSLIGSVVKIEGNIGDGNVVIRFLNKSSLQFEDVTYYGKQTDFIVISERIWPFLLAMPSPVDRVSVALNQELCDLIASLHIDSSIDVYYGKTSYSAIIKYAGTVEAMGTGYYLGLELLGRIQITKYDGSYAGQQYFSALPGTALFVSVDKIYPVAHYLASKNKRQQIDHFEAQNIDLRPTRDTRSVEFVTEKPKPKLTPKQDNEMDLIEIIGSWPGVVDNKVTIVEPLDRPTRNKSLNPVSHFITTKKISRPKSEISNAKIVNLIHTEPEIRYEGPSLPDVDYDTPAISTPSLPTSHPTPTPTATSVTTPSGELLSVGTLVEVVTDISAPLYGVVRWLSVEGELAGVELEEDHEDLPLVLTDGTHNNQRYFNCATGRALFVPVKQCQRDSRFDDTPVINESKMFGQRDSPIVPGSVPPLSMPTEEDVLAVCGKFRGIQGHHNSCYLDATLFAMFTYTAVFDSLLFRPRASNDISQYEEVQRVLREEIVNPLRQQLYVRADRVMKLRTLLEELSSVSGLTSEEKDPEEFLNSLLAQILKAEPFLKLSSGQEAFHYQLFVEKDEDLALPSVQQLFEQSFLSSDIKLKEVPSCLIIQMPRFGKNFKMYPRILPSQLLDVTDIIENSPRQCTVCGSLATYECRECLDQCGVGLESIGFCNLCLDKAHAHTRRSSHAPRLLHIPQDFIIMAEHCRPPRLFMELFAVVCIETSHYVAFVKCGSGHNAPWCFFDSMADRKGEQHGYNIPEMVACPDVSTWLSDEGAVCRVLHDKFPHDKQLPEHARRLLCDAYICMYQSPDVMMYR